MDHSCHYTAVMVLLIFWDVFADFVCALPSGRMMGDCGGQSFFGDNIPGRCREDFFWRLFFGCICDSLLADGFFLSKRNCIKPGKML